jgi:hypothetical protein
MAGQTVTGARIGRIGDDGSTGRYFHPDIFAASEETGDLLVQVRKVLRVPIMLCVLKDKICYWSFTSLTTRLATSNAKMRTAILAFAYSLIIFSACSQLEFKKIC